jgi:hypothetical protein
MKPSVERVHEIKPKVMATDMTLRDYFAINVPNGSILGKQGETYFEEATERYKFADAMLKARENGI